MFSRSFVLLIFAVFCGVICHAQNDSGEKLNVVDYYRLDLDNAFDNKGMRAVAVVEDLKNGYLRIEGAFEGYIEVALFRKKDSTPILLVSSTSCGPVCTSVVKALEHSDGKMVDVTESTIPVISSDKVKAIYLERKAKSDDLIEEGEVPLVFELPRFGRTIKVKVDTTFAPSDITVFRIKFSNDKFILAK